MTDFISASPLLILTVLVVLSWFTGSKGLKLLTVAAFFLLPVLIGNVQFQLSEQFLKDVLNFWINEAVESLADYVKQRLIGV
jgi:type IV secretory pathway TrbL component